MCALKHNEKCKGNCCGKSCGACGGALFFTPLELDLLRCFAQIPFLPVARPADSDAPVCFEEEIGGAKDLEPAISMLQQKGLIQVDYNIPLQGFDYHAYRMYPHRGSMALTAKGIQVLELLDIQGIEA